MSDNTPIALDPLEKLWPDSKNVKRTKYLEDQKILEVEFQTGKKYHYLEFPRAKWDELVKAESIGSFINRDVKGIYSYQLVD